MPRLCIKCAGVRGVVKQLGWTHLEYHPIVMLFSPSSLNMCMSSQQTDEVYKALFKFVAQNG